MIDADGAVLGVYRKSHSLRAGYQEKFFFKPGNTGFRAYATKYGTLGIAICWTNGSPEVARALALAGADVTSIPPRSEASRRSPSSTAAILQRVMIGHAVANASDGRRQPHRPRGRPDVYAVLHLRRARRQARRAPARRARIASATLDLDQIRRIRASMGFFRDRRPTFTSH